MNEAAGGQVTVSVDFRARENAGKLSPFKLLG